MAKQALQGILSDLLGKYVDGLSLDNLRVGIFSGNIEIQNLTLKLNVLDQFNLPLRLIKGSIGTIKITIPWTNLGSKPVIFSLDGLFLQVDYTELKDRTAEELAELTHNLKQSILEKVQRLAFSNACSAMKVGSEDLKDETNKRHNFSSFLQNMGQRIASKILAISF